MLVRDLLLEILQDVDPVISGTDTPFSASTVGAQDGGVFSKEDHLAFYNRARLTMYERMRARATKRQLVRLFGSSMIRNTAYPFTNGQGLRPSGYIELPFFSHSAIKEIILLPNEFQDVVRAGRDPRYKESADRCFIFEVSGLSQAVAAGGGFIADVNVVDDVPVGDEGIGPTVGNAPYFFSLSGSNFLSDKTDYVILYMGIPIYTLADITGGVTVESFDTIFHARIIKLTKRIAIQKNMIDATAVDRLEASNG